MSRINQFWYLPMDVVHHGPGAVAMLPQELGRLGLTRAMVVSSPTVGASPALGGRVRELLGQHFVGMYAGVQPHVPYSCLQGGLDLVKELQPDVLITVGAGSVVDAGRALALAAGEGLSNADDLQRFRALYTPPDSTVLPATSGRSLPIIAVPTTLSAAEFANAGAVTSESRGTKDLLIADELTPRAVLLDPELAVTTPAHLWVSTGMRALDHAVETVYSPRGGAVTDALSLEAVRLLAVSLRATVQNPTDLGAREDGQLAAWMSYFGEMNLTLGLSHAIGHQIGARHGVQHGWTSCVVLPSVLRWLAPATAPQQARIAGALGVDTNLLNDEDAAAAAASAVEQLVLDLGLPSSLLGIGVTPQDFEGLAAAVMQDLVVAGSPRPVTAADVIEILAASG